MRRWAWLIAVLLVSFSVVWAFARQPRAEAQNAITEVSVEHTGCYGPCPVYKVTLRSNRIATFVGHSYVSKIGTYTAKVGGFDQLAEAIKQRHFQQFSANYTTPITDQSHTVTTVVQGGHRKTVDNYADTGPQQLWEIQTLIDGAVAEAHWKKVSNSTSYP